MDEIKAKLNILDKALDRKAEILTQIANITENQEMFFENLRGDELKYYVETSIDEKQKLIDELNTVDGAFEGIFASFKGKLNENKNLYKNEIKSMQEKIRNIVSLDIKVRAAEEKNKRYMENMMKRQSAQAPKIKGLKVSKDYILKQYAKNKGSN